MADAQSEQNSEAKQASASEAWQEVGEQFQALGQSLATAFHTMWGSEENRKHLERMQTNLEAMAHQVNQTIEEIVSSTQTQKMRDEMERATESVRKASEQSAWEVRTHMLSALHQVKTEVDRIIQRLEKEAPPADKTSTEQSE